MCMDRMVHDPGAHPLFEHGAGPPGGVTGGGVVDVVGGAWRAIGERRMNELKSILAVLDGSGADAVVLAKGRDYTTLEK